MKKNSSKTGKMIWRYRYLYFLMLPGMIYLFVNNYMPIAGLVIAFKKVDFKAGIWSSPWNGIKNFKYLFDTKDAWIITRNTIAYNVAFIVIALIVSIVLAIFLSEMLSKRMRSFHQACILIPYIISYVVVSYLVYAFLGTNGLLNKGVLSEPVNWYLESKYWPFILILVNTWKNAGYASVIYLATILGFDGSIYEAAQLDGVTPWQKIKYITIPLLKPTIITLTMLNVGRIFYSDFGLFYQVPQNSGAILNVTNVLDTYVYRGLLELGDIGMSSAAGLYQSVVGFAIIMIVNTVVRKLSPDDAII